MLVLNSFGLQNALERAPLDLGHFFGRVHSSAYTCATLVRDSLGPAGFMKYSPDSHFVQTSYAVLSLLKVRFPLSIFDLVENLLCSFFSEYQLVRPEFQAFLDNEQKTLDLVRDVADTLDNIAANPLHTPALYSGFLRALISAKLDQQQQPSSHHSMNGDVSAPLSDGGEQQQQQLQLQQSQLQQQLNNSIDGSQGGGGDAYTPNSYGNPLHLFGDTGNNGNGHFMLNEFQFDSEMGPVADISTFPPTMAPHPSEDSLGVLTMENILSSGFWDSMLVPGAFAFLSFFFFWLWLWFIDVLMSFFYDRL